VKERTVLEQTSHKVVLVTGAARGIGHAVAMTFASEGHSVLGLDILPEEERIEGDFEHRMCDVADEQQVSAAVGELVKRHGRIDVVASIAGVVVVGPMETLSWSDFRRVVDVNLGGIFLICKHVLPVMKGQRSGVIVNAGSVSAHVGQIDHTLYGATKAGILALTRALAWEAAPYGIRVVSVSPGSVDTEMLREDCRLEAMRTGRSYAEIKKEREDEQAFHRWARPNEIASVVHFLAGDGASYITGSDVLVDCGWTAK
jgi:NAD(P)-dependent dehydrogenase (short-subunit alcohol dehydrogenase family)